MLLARATASLVLLGVLGACGSSESDPEADASSASHSSASPSASPSTPVSSPASPSASSRPEKDYAALLRAVHQELSQAKHTVISRVQVAGTSDILVQEFDTFALAESRRLLSKRVTNVGHAEGEPASYSTDIAMSSNQRFLRSREWEAPAAGCWLDLTDTAVGDTGLTASDFPLTPNAVAALSRIRVGGNDLDEDGRLHADMSARDAVPMLGVSGQALVGLQISVSTTVPVVLDFDGEHLHSLSIDGSDAVDGLGAEISSDLAAYLGQVAAYVEYSAETSTTSVAPPPRDQVMTDLDEGCAAPRT